MIKQRSSAWKTILPGALIGLIVTLLAMYGSFVVGLSGFSLMFLAALLVVAVVVAIVIPKHRMLSISMIAGGLIGFVASWLVLVAFLSGGLFSNTIQDDLKPAELEQWIGLDFPSSASNMRSHAEGFQDWQVFVRFEMPKSDLQEFLRLNKLEPESNPNTQLSNTDLERDWWKPDGSTKPLLFVPKVKLEGTPQPSTKTGFFPTIQVSDLEGGRVLVFVNAFNT
jgi:hypothetical protein